MYYTNNAGTSWNFFGPGLFPCRDVQIGANGKTMRVATFGRGIWEEADVTTITPVPLLDGVEAATLSAAKTAGGTTLSWFVDEEKSGSIYKIERSMDGAVFENLGSINGFGGTARQCYTFEDATTSAGTYLYQIHSIGRDGSEHFSNRVQLHYGIDQLLTYQPYPNPFLNSDGAKMTVQFELPERNVVSLHIYNTTGTLVRTLVNNAALDGGVRSVQWDGRDATGQLVSPGAYLYSISTSSFGSMTGKIAVAKP
jgi:hypothetical protein